jgi:hypothetical protein
MNDCRVLFENPEACQAAHTAVLDGRQSCACADSPDRNFEWHEARIFQLNRFDMLRGIIEGVGARIHLSGKAGNRPRGTKAALKLVHWESKSKSLFRYRDSTAK